MDIRQSLAQGGPLTLADHEKKDEYGNPLLVTYTIDPSGPGVEGLFSAWLIDNARRRIEAMVRGMEPAKAAEYRNSFTGQVGAGEYEWGGVNAAKAVVTVPGLAYYLMLRMKPHHPELTHAKVEKLLIDNRHIFLEQANVAEANPTNGARVAE